MSKAGKDLTQGNITSALILFAVPFMLSNILQAAYNLTDTFIISRFVGAGGVAASNSGGQVLNFTVNGIMGLSVGGTTLIAQFAGAGERDKLRKAVAVFLYIMLALGAVLTVAIMVFAAPLLAAINTPPEVLGEAGAFLRIYGAGVIFLFGYNAISAVFRGVGNSFAPLVFVIISIVMNIALTLLFVAVFKQGIAGAAIATTISIVSSFICALVYFLKNLAYFGFSRTDLAPNLPMGGNMLKIGVPSSVQGMIFNLSVLLMTAFINKYGINAAAAVGIGTKIDSLFLLPLNAIGAAAAPMIAQNMGAGQTDRVRRAVYSTAVINFALALCCFTLARMFPRQLFSLFTKDEAVIAIGVGYMKTVAFNHIFVSMLISFNALAIGAGHTVFPLCTTIMNGFVFRVPLAMLFETVFKMGLAGVFVGFGFANIGGAAAGFIYYKIGVWKKQVRAIQAEGQTPLEEKEMGEIEQPPASI